MHGRIVISANRRLIRSLKQFSSVLLVATRGRMDRSRMDQFTFVHQNRFIPVEDDIQLRYQSWRRTPNLGVVILVHDFSSHSDR